MLRQAALFIEDIFIGYTCNYELPSGGAICLVDEIVDLRLSSC
jgi:hypothetical protein